MIYQAPKSFIHMPPPRIGGVGIFLALVISAWVSHSILSLERDLLLLQICLCAPPAFAIGLIEDLTKKWELKPDLSPQRFLLVLAFIF
jgi:UDP-N-acetylmuramyl pentapeptide phosphotransferase/UDP-N-acetylglucosamine-1-phosphate transferase